MLCKTSGELSHTDNGCYLEHLVA